MVFPSKFSVKTLIERWDEYTSPARFAGSDDTLDLIFIAKRNGDKVKLTRRARSAREPFSTVFQGKIKSSKSGSSISGFFRKSVADYVTVFAVLGLIIYIRSVIIERGDSLDTINFILISAIILSGLLIITTRRSKRKYSEFLFRITGTEIPVYLSKKEMHLIEENDQTE